MNERENNDEVKGRKGKSGSYNTNCYVRALTMFPLTPLFTRSCNNIIVTYNSYAIIRIYMSKCIFAHYHPRDNTGGSTRGIMAKRFPYFLKMFFKQDVIYIYIFLIFLIFLKYLITIFYSKNIFLI